MTSAVSRVNAMEYMTSTYPRFKNANEKAELLKNRLNTLRQRYAMHEATHAEYGIIRARNLQRALQTLKNRSRTCDGRNKRFLTEFQAMEDRTVHVESFSFARRALERAKGEYFRVVTARRPAWQQHALRTKERRMKELDKEKQKMEAQRSRSAELFKHEKELNSVLSKKREETLALQVMIRREEMKRQLELEETQQHEDGLRRNRERAIASENDQLRAKLEALTAKREEEKLQHERALAAMRDAEDKVLSRTAQHRFDNGTMETTNAWTPNVPGKSSTASQGHHKSPLERMQERTHKFEGKMHEHGEQAVADVPSSPSVATLPPASRNDSGKGHAQRSPLRREDENDLIQRRMQERAEAEFATSQQRRESPTTNQTHVASAGSNDHTNALDISSWSWSDWVEAADLLIEHIQKEQNRNEVKFGYGDPDRSWGHLFLQTTEDERRLVLEKSHHAARERMGGRHRREVASLGMLKWCLGLCEIIRSVARGLIDIKLVEESLGRGALPLADVTACHESSGDGRAELWMTLMAHMHFLKDKCGLSPTYIARVFGPYFTPPMPARIMDADKLVAGVLLEVLIPKPPSPISKKPSPKKVAPSLSPRSGLGNLIGSNNSLLTTASKAPYAMGSMSSMSMLGLERQEANRREQKPKVNVLDKVKRGYNFEDEFDDDDDEVLAELTSGALRDTSVSGKRADAGTDNAPSKSSEGHNKSLNSTKTNNEISDVIELESYEDSFDDDF